MCFLQETEIHVQVSGIHDQTWMYEFGEDVREYLCSGKKQTLFFLYLKRDNKWYCSDVSYFWDAVSRIRY